MTLRTAEPAYPKPGGENLHGGSGRRGKGRGKEGPEREKRTETPKAKPWGEEPSPLFTRREDPSPERERLEEPYNTDGPVKKRREKPPGQKDGQRSTQPPDPEGSQNSGDNNYRDEQQEKEEKDEQEREAGRKPVRERVRDRKLARPPRGEVLDRDNTFCRPCGITFSRRLPFLEHYLGLHPKKRRTKDGGKTPSPSHQGRSLNHPRTQEQEVSDRGRWPQV